MSYQDKAEITREFYRSQGERRAKKNITDYLARLQLHHPGKAWQLRDVITIISQLAGPKND